MRTYDLLRKSSAAGALPLHPARRSSQETAAVAIYHASTKAISRGAGRSAVAAIAYRTASRLVDERTGQVHDYTRKGGVVSTEILLPDGGSVERNELWNAAEAAEKRKDARTAREWTVALPAELNAQQRQELAVGFCVELATRYGVAVDVAIHLPDSEGDNRNHHAHILTTTRQVQRDSRGALVMGEKAVIEWSDRARRAKGLGPAADEVKAVRQLWERVANQALQRAGYQERIDCRSLKAQGIDKEATIHLGPAASDMERRGIETDRGGANRQAVANNQERAQLQAQVIELEAERRRREQAKQEKAEQAKKARREKAAEARAAQRAELDRAMQERIERGARELERLQALERQPTEPARPAPAQQQAQPRQAAPQRPPSAAELAQVIERLRPPPVAELVAQDAAVQAAQRAHQALEQQVQNEQAREAQARQEAAQWRQAHPMKAKAHDLGLFASEYLAEREAQAQEARQAWQKAAPGLPGAERAVKNARREAEKRILVEQAPIREKLAKLQAALDQRREQERLIREFEALAEKRAARAHGWGDGGPEWQAVPERLREKIDLYNRAPPEARAAIWERLERDPRPGQHLQQMLEQHQALVRGRSRGLSR